MVASDSDSDIEIIDSKVSLKPAKNSHDIIQDLEIIENQNEPSTSKINISLSQDASMKSMKIKFDSPGSSSKVKLILSDGPLGKRKRNDTENTDVVRSKFSKSTSELHLECCFEPKTGSSLSTSEMVLQGLMDKSSSSSEESEDGESEIEPKSVSVSDCVESLLRSCERLLPSNDYSSVQNKITKNLRRLDPKHNQSIPLKEHLHQAWSLIDSDSDNIFIHVKDVIEELKKYKGESFASSSGATTSDNSDCELKKTIIPSVSTRKRVSLTTLSSTPPSKPNTNSDLKLVDKIINKPKEDFLSSFVKVGSSSSLENKLGDADVSQTRNVDDEKVLHSSNKVAQSRRGASDKHINKLEKALEACARNIAKCEEAEIDWDQEESNFVMADKWKKKFMAIYNKIAEYKGEAPDLERSADKRFTFSEGKYPEVNKKIEKYVNRNKTFPDFWDIKALIEKVNLENKLGLTEMQIHNESEKIFIMVGRKLKKRRNFDDGNAFYSYLPTDDAGDPADENPQLQKRLDELGREAEKKINKVFEDFVEKQSSGSILKEGGGDESDSETEVESEEDEGDEAAVDSVDLTEHEATEKEGISLDDSSNSSKASWGSLDSLLGDEDDVQDIVET